MLLSLYYWRRRRPVLPLLIPMMFIMVITLTALIYNTAGLIDFRAMAVSNWPLLSLNVILLTLILWMIVEAMSLFMKARREVAG
jgi:carbon starvation protein